MNKLSTKDRAQVNHPLCEGMATCGVTRLTGISKTTVSKLAGEAGQAAAWYQDRVFQNLARKKLQIDEIWGFVGAKAKNASAEAKATGTAGDAWLWLAIDCRDLSISPFMPTRWW